MYGRETGMNQHPILSRDKAILAVRRFPGPASVPVIAEGATNSDRKPSQVEGLLHEVIDRSNDFPVP